MSEHSEHIDFNSADTLSVTKRALTALDELQQRLAAFETAASEPIALTGIGCRFPGGAIGADGFWELVLNGRDAITEVPAERWDWTAYYDADPQKSGKMNTRWGGFLPDIDKFDAGFFGIAPREAKYMDPQHRIVAEVAWEALEDAGLPLDRLKASRTGVFLGIYNSDYLCLQHQNPAIIDLHTGTGTVHALAANRLSYLFDLRGPSLAIDTSCSSSLVAIHLAVQSLRLRESDIALAGGVNLMLSPSSGIATAKLVNMAADGRCKTFDRRADGIVRGEGCAVVVLKRLSDALAAGDAIWAVIRGTAVNQDGRSNGLTAPNGLAQEAVIRQALDNARVQPEQIGYVEAHGTGTPLGDPLEIEAISAVLGQKTPDSIPCYVGSVKTNLGHLEAAAGIAGFIKTVLSLYHRTIPPHLHFVHPNPQFDLTGTRLIVPTDRHPWEFRKGVRLAGVSAFSIGGTNAHLILEEAPEMIDGADIRNCIDVRTGNVEPEDRHFRLLPLSARTAQSLHLLAAEYQAFPAHQTDEATAIAMRDLCYTAATRRTHHQYRKAFVAHSPQDFSEQLTEYVSREADEPIRQFNLDDAGAVLVFPGQGSQWAGMGRSLLRHEPLFRQKVIECAAVVKEYLGFDLLAELENPENSRLHETEIAQPAIWALEVGLAALLQAAGLSVGGVIGHSVGEVAAAQIAGMLTLEEAGKIVCVRARLLSRIEGQGGMLALAANYQAADELAKRFDLDIAAYNSQRNIVLSGDVRALDAAERDICANDKWCRRLDVQGAFHSRHVRVLQDELRQSLRDLPRRPAKIPFYSTVHAGTVFFNQSPEEDYWVDNLCQAVRFQTAVNTAFQQGHRFFVEAGPQRVLQTDIRLTLKTLSDDFQVISLQQYQSDNHKTYLSGLGQMFESGFDLDWESVIPKGRIIRLPRYPWQRKSYWITVPGRFRTEQPRRLSSETSETADSLPPLIGETSDYMLENRLPTAVPIFEGRLSLQTHPGLADHRLNGQPVLSVGHYLETMLGALSQLWPEQEYLLEDLVIQQMLPLPKTGETKIQIVVLPSGEGADIRFYAGRKENRSGTVWKLYASAKGKPEAREERVNRTLKLNSLLKRLTKKDPPPQFTSKTQTITEKPDGIWVGPDEVLVNLTFPDTDSSRGGTEPLSSSKLVSAALQFLPELITPSESEEKAIPIPARLRRAGFRSAECRAIWFHLNRMAAEQPGEILLNIACFDEQGQFFGEIGGLGLKLVSNLSDLSQNEPADLDELIYEKVWIPQSIDKPTDLSNGKSSQPNTLAADLAGYNALLPHLDKLSSQLILQALARLGWIWSPGEHFTISSIIRRFGIKESYQRLLFRLFQILSEEGFIEPTGSGEWLVKRLPNEPDTISSDNRQTWLELSDRFKNCKIEIELLRRCGENLEKVLTGECDPLDLLFADSECNASDLYHHSAVARYLNESAARAAKEIWEKRCSGDKLRPASKWLRILEVGGGTGATTAAILAEISDGCADYLFTDVAPSLLRKAADRFREFSFFRTEIFDIEQQPNGQAIGSERFDLIVAANVLHTTCDLHRSLGHLREVLSDDGILLLIEGTTAHRWIDLTFGLTEGWWKFSDERSRATDQRGNFKGHPLLTGRDWERLLQAEEFVEVIPVVDSAQTPETGHIVLQARRRLSVKTEENPLRAGSTNGSGGQIPPFGKQNDRVAGSTKFWLVFGGESCALTGRLLEQLSAAGVQYRLVVPAETLPLSANSRNGSGFSVAPEPDRLNPADPVAYRHLLKSWFESLEPSTGASSNPAAGVIWLWSATVPEPVDEPSESAARAQWNESAGQCRQLLWLIQALLTGQPETARRTARLWVVTAEAQPAADLVSRMRGAAAAGLWGLGAVLSREHPEVWGGLIDVERETVPEAAIQITQEIFKVPDESIREEQVGYRNGLRYVARLGRARLKQGTLKQVSVRSDGWYLVSGGLGGLGLAVGEWLLGRGAGRVVLASRGSGSDWPERVRRMQEKFGGGRVEAVPTDIGRWSEVSGLVSRENERSGQLKLRGVIHSAGEVADGVLVRQDWERFERVLRAKVAGGWNLHYATLEEEPDFFILFSSAVTLLGMAGLSSYTAANSCLDALAHYRHSRGLPALSINWSGWEGLGMARAVGRRRERQWRAQGLYPIRSDQALGALEFTSDRHLTQAGIMRVDWNKFSERLNSRQKLFFAQVFAETPVGEAVGQPATPVSPDLRKQLAELPADLRTEFLLAEVRKLAAQVLGSEAGESLNPQRPLSELGLDSLMSVELRNLLVTTTGISLPTAFLFEAPTISAITKHLLQACNLPPDDKPTDRPAADEEEKNSLRRILEEIEGLSETETQAELIRFSETTRIPGLEAGIEE